MFCETYWVDMMFFIYAVSKHFTLPFRRLYYHFMIIIIMADVIYAFHRRNLEQAGQEESLKLESDIGGGLVLQRHIYIPKGNSRVFRIESSILARKVGAGSGGFSRFSLKTSVILV